MSSGFIHMHLTPGIFNMPKGFTVFWDFHLNYSSSGKRLNESQSGALSSSHPVESHTDNLMRGCASESTRQLWFETRLMSNTNNSTFKAVGGKFRYISGTSLALFSALWSWESSCHACKIREEHCNLVILREGSYQWVFYMKGRIMG